MVPATSILPSASRAGVDGLGEVDAEAVAVGQAHHAGAVDRAIDVAGEPGDERIGLAAAAEEGHVDAVHVVLVDQHADVAAGLEHAHELAGASSPVGTSVPMLPLRIWMMASLTAPILGRR